VNLQITRLDERAVLPAQAHDDDAGFDLSALDAAKIGPGERAMVGTGIAIALSRGYAGLVLPRSGLASKHGISLVNSPGLIDAGYRGEIKVLLLNTDPNDSFEVEAGMRIAQLMVIAVETPFLEEVDHLGETTRGDGGFGSSGS
jgi:dUTP pyrophosphatase